jgi:hypothetical protein
MPGAAVTDMPGAVAQVSQTSTLWGHAHVDARSGGAGREGFWTAIAFAAQDPR